MAGPDGASRAPEDSTYVAWESAAHKIPIWAMVVASELSGLSMDELLAMPSPTWLTEIREEVIGLRKLIERVVLAAEQEDPAENTASA
ncbi:hypothetical protein [Candidatus Nephthysia bennettiae]|uniref:Uncharacterized protein n=1 Tax=Candidatus Nephthysia bennettiae TaxID=3127016 RepID=A0A934K9B4_9BACT|nr:hypothetical protein [Candidatus Dormibacteraeota bacterium]